MKLTKALVLAAIISMLAAAAAPAASAATPYEAYTYNFYEESVPLPAPYVPEKAVSGQSLGVGSFNQPNDIFVTEDGFIYILDSGNARVIALDNQWRVLRTIDGFEMDGRENKFANPSGIFVSEKKEIYVADTDKGRVVVLTSDGQLIRVVDNPQSEILPPDFKFVPLKVTADRAGRIFVVSRGMYEGIMQFDEKGKFIGYVGTIKVTASPADRLWRALATDAQQAQMQLFIPTEFASVDIDRKGFVYATTVDINSTETIKRLNPSGQDVLKRFGHFPPRGDIRYRILGNNSGPSKLVDIKVLGGGMYVALDSLRARLFAYNDEGELLYAFGGRGTQLGVFNTPVAVERVADKLVVLDRGKNNIVVFAPTRFGKLVSAATTEHYNGNTDRSVDIWREVLRMNSNFDIAYRGIGRSLLMQKKNKEAMEYFKLGMDRKYYSTAFKRYRREVMQEQFGHFMTTLMVLIAAFVAYRIVRKVRVRRSERREA
ncbi:hypothetical protein SAMN05216378_5798 [Paenibacillus catalpae]|uniref:NHL repeat-containing protein n=1 Tax=Paenibacillus catalpae TaxID=1045775 RepID=A0A1I2HEN2_9BACL|nr:NHL repeat-containing protein [Paenibacillus catalpae]SFF28725.1 hypothetical protein SAMN05216378_5798 [Paenibacillus catalpae]